MMKVLGSLTSIYTPCLSFCIVSVSSGNKNSFSLLHQLLPPPHCIEEMEAECQGPGVFKAMCIQDHVCPCISKAFISYKFQRQAFLDPSPECLTFLLRSLPDCMGAPPKGLPPLLPLKIRFWDPKNWQTSAEDLQELTHFWIPSARSNSVTLEAKEKVVCSEITTTLDSLWTKFVSF
jgi:hypothetical protein